MPSGQYSSRRKQHSWDAWLASRNRDGFVLVPKEPTEEMIDKGEWQLRDTNEDVISVYKAMTYVPHGSTHYDYKCGDYLKYNGATSWDAWLLDEWTPIFMEADYIDKNIKPL